MIKKVKCQKTKRLVKQALVMDDCVLTFIPYLQFYCYLVIISAGRYIKKPMIIAHRVIHKE